MQFFFGLFFSSLAVSHFFGGKKKGKKKQLLFREREIEGQQYRVYMEYSYRYIYCVPMYISYYY